MTYTERFEIYREKRQRQIQRRIMLGISVLLLIFSFYVHIQTAGARQEYAKLQQELAVQQTRLQVLQEKYK